MLLLNPFLFNSLVSTTFDPNFAGTGIVLSNGNTRATNSGSWKTVLGTTGKSGSGKWQFEVECVTSSGNPLAGIADKTTIPAILNNYLGFTGPNAISHASSTIYKALSSAGVESGTQRTWSVANDVLTVALNLDTNNVTFYINGVQSRSLTLPPGVTWYPATSSELNSVMQLRTKALEYPVSGYSNWDDSLPTEDPLWMNVTSLLHFNGTEGSSTIVDQRGLTWTQSAELMTHDTSVKKYGTSSIKALNVPAQRLALSTNAALGFGTGDYTIEFFVRANTLSSSSYAVIAQLNNGVLNHAVYLNNKNSFICRFAGAVDVTKTGIVLDQWYHIAVTRASGIGYFFVDGQLVGAPTAHGDNFGTTFPAYLFASAAGGNLFKGHMDEFRVTKGVARYTANFTPPTMEFPNS